MLINLTRLKDDLKFSSKKSPHPNFCEHACELLHVNLDSHMLIDLLVMPSTGVDDSLALKKKVTIEDVFGPDLHIHDPDAKWLSGE